MNTSKKVWILTAAAMLNAALLAPTAVANDRFSLIRAVPDDVFLCTAGRHNAERAFLDAYWGEVFDALKASGIGGDIMELLGSQLGEEQRATIEEFKQRAMQLLEGVDWKSLGGGEVVFAERLSKVVKTESQIYMGPPDMVFLIRGADGTAGKNFEGLVGILNAIAAEVNKGTGKETFLVEKASKLGATVATLDFMRMVPQAPPMPLSVALRGDVLILAFGHEILADALGLLDGSSSKTTLAKSKRFKRAFEHLPDAEDEMTFFDMQAMLKSFEPLIDGVLAQAVSGGGGDAYAGAPKDPKVEEYHAKAIEAYRANDIEKALEFTKKEYEVVEGNARAMYNLACFHTLLGHKEKGLTWLEKAVDHGFFSPNQIGGDSDLASLHEEPRFKAALAKATEKAKAGGGQEDWGKQVKVLAERLLDVPGMIDYVAGVVYTDEYSVHRKDITALVPDAATKPFYPVFGKRESLKRFDRYLPKETVSFSVDAGFDLTELYRFVIDTIKALGPKGDEILQKWAAVQAQGGIDVQKEILSVIHGEAISATLEGNAWLMMMRVNDEEIARTKLASALQFLAAEMPKLAQQNPMLAMFMLRVEPCTHEKLGGFHTVAFGMHPPMVCGVRDGYVMLGSSAHVVSLALATAAGEHPSVRQNETVMADAIRPTGKFRSISYTDKRSMGKDLATLAGAVSMGAGMGASFLPDEEARQMLMKVIGIVGKLSPVLQKINFYKSTSASCTFDGTAWHSHSVTNYRAPSKTANPEDI